MLRTSLYTLLALLAFAANSLLCRLALAQGAIDPTSFTTIRLVAGAVVLVSLVRLRGRSPGATTASWLSGLLLALYAVPFAFAYRHLSAGTGALLLFGAVQLTMILGGLRAGRRPAPLQWLGLAIACSGLLYLVLPGLAAPPPDAAGLMLVAGLAWGLYSLKGRGVRDPLAQTAANFLRALPWVVLVSLLSVTRLTVDPRGFVLATLSGAVASGLGYVIWYQVLPELAPIVASMVQLAVPPLAALGGILLLSESPTRRLLLASLAILGGIALALWHRPAVPVDR